MNAGKPCGGEATSIDRCRDKGKALASGGRQRSIASTHRFVFLLTTLCLMGCGRQNPPNIVLIVIDTLRAEALGAYGAPIEVSPEIDRLARQGILFNRVTAQCTWTRPSVGSLLTSQYPRTVGLYKEQGEVLPSAAVSLPETFREAGYRTLGATANPVINSFYGFDQGFDRYIDAEVVFQWMPVGEGQAVRGQDGRWLPTASDIFDAMLALIEADRAGPPYFVFVNLMDVHEFFEDEVPIAREYRDLFPQIASEYSRRYMQAVRHTSREVGLFVERLQGVAGWEDSLFVITSDHGETLEDHPALAEPVSHGYLAYESQSWVPLIFYGADPRLGRGLEIETPVRLLDLTPTLLDWAGLEPLGLYEGTSLLPLMLGSSRDVGLPDFFVVETKFRNSDKLAVVGHDWIYVENRDGHGGTRPRELHRRGVTENGETTDVLGRFPQIGDDMAAYLRQWDSEHPEQSPTSPTDAPDPDHLEHLRSLGYVD